MGVRDDGGCPLRLIGVLREPTTGRILATALLTLGTVLSRVTAGWGCALAVIGVGVLARTVAEPASAPVGLGLGHRRVGWFHSRSAWRSTSPSSATPYMIPFEDQVWTAQSAARQAVLADGGVVGLRFLPTTLFNYLRPDGVRFSNVFPFLSPPADPAPPVGGVLLEMQYRTPSATAFMPLLFVLAIIGAVVIARPGAGVGRASLRIPGSRGPGDHLRACCWSATSLLDTSWNSFPRSSLPAPLDSSPCSPASRPGHARGSSSSPRERSWLPCSVRLRTRPRHFRRRGDGGRLGVAGLRRPAAPGLRPHGTSAR